MSFETWEEHRDRIKAEREKATAENLCPEEVNEWAAQRWGSDLPKHKICCRKLSPDAVQLGVNLCGLHLRQHRKVEAEEAARRIMREEQKRANDRHKILREVKEKQEADIITELARHGVEKAELSKPWHYRRANDGWIVSLPLSVLWKVLDVLPMLDPDDAVKAFEEAEAKAVEAAKPKDAEVPF